MGFFDNAKSIFNKVNNKKVNTTENINNTENINTTEKVDNNAENINNINNTDIVNNNNKNEIVNSDNVTNKVNLEQVQNTDTMLEELDKLDSHKLLREEEVSHIMIQLMILKEALCARIRVLINYGFKHNNIAYIKNDKITEKGYFTAIPLAKYTSSDLYIALKKNKQM